MKKSRFTESQIVGILEETDSGIAVNEIWRKHGISSATSSLQSVVFEL
jgi:putative transposase